MSNALLTTDKIVDRALMRFSESATALKVIPKTYASEFKGAAKVGDEVRVPIPQHAVIREGRVAQPAPLQTLVRPVTIQKQVGFDLTFNSAELALDIEEFERRYLSQQIADLVVDVEADVQRLMYQWTPNQTGTPDGQWTNVGYGNLAKKFIEDNGGGKGQKNMILNNAAESTLIPNMRGLYNPTSEISSQYKDGVITRAAGFDWVSSTVAPLHTNGAGANYLTDTPGTTQTGSSIHVDTGTGAITRGSIVTFGVVGAGVHAVHPQTKANLGYLRQFVVTEDYPGGEGDLQIFPAVVATGSEQNVSAAVADGLAVTVNGTASDSYGINLAFRPEAFQFVTVDLPELDGWETSRREFEGISMRLTRGSDIQNDTNLWRFDIMWGFGALRPQWACRVANDPANLTLA